MACKTSWNILINNGKKEPLLVLLGIKPMPQTFKVIRSRDEWKGKAIQRANELREFRKTQKRHLMAIAAFKEQIRMLKQANKGKKNSGFS